MTTEKRYFITEKLIIGTEKWIMTTEKRYFITEKSIIGTEI